MLRFALRRSGRGASGLSSLAGSCEPAVRIKRDLFGADDRRALRSCAEDQALQRGDLCAQIIVLAFESQHHLGKSRRVRGEIFGAKRHIAELHERTRNRQQNKTLQATFVESWPRKFGQ
ncbi:hypothetical protein J2R90_011372 [Bradyrhizobium japonicum]|nr:hypothetical protein [Bradyrhizobium japonicum]